MADAAGDAKTRRKKKKSHKSPSKQEDKKEENGTPSLAEPTSPGPENQHRTEEEDGEPDNEEEEKAMTVPSLLSSTEAENTAVSKEVHLKQIQNLRLSYQKISLGRQREQSSSTAGSPAACRNVFTSLDSDGQVLVAGTNHGTIYAYLRKQDDPTNFQLVDIVSAFQEVKPVILLKLSPDRTWIIAVQSSTNKIMCFQTTMVFEDKKLEKFELVCGAHGRISHVEWSRDGELIFLGCPSGIVCCHHISELTGSSFFRSMKSKISGEKKDCVIEEFSSQVVQLNSCVFSEVVAPHSLIASTKTAVHVIHGKLITRQKVYFSVLAVVQVGNKAKEISLGACAWGGKVIAARPKRKLWSADPSTGEVLFTYKCAEPSTQTMADETSGADNPKPSKSFNYIQSIDIFNKLKVGIVFQRSSIGLLDINQKRIRSHGGCLHFLNFGSSVIDHCMFDCETERCEFGFVLLDNVGSRSIGVLSLEDVKTHTKSDENPFRSNEIDDKTAQLSKSNQLNTTTIESTSTDERQQQQLERQRRLVGLIEFHWRCHRRRQQKTRQAIRTIANTWREYAKKKGEQNSREIDAALNIQRIFRGYRRWRLLQNKKKELRAATTIHHAIHRYLCYKELLYRKLEKQKTAARKIQKVVRGYFGRKYYHKLKETARERLEHQAATQIQSVVGAFIQRKSFQIELTSQRCASIKLQSFWRMVEAKTVLYCLQKAKRYQEKLEWESAARIQAFVRSCLSKRKLHLLREEERIRRNKAAICIQCMIRQKLARSRLLEQRKKKEMECKLVQSRRMASSLVIQWWWKKVKKCAPMKNAQRNISTGDNDEEGSAAALSPAAIKIQKVLRGYLDRRMFRWKQTIEKNSEGSTHVHASSRLNDARYHLKERTRSQARENLKRLYVKRLGQKVRQTFHMDPHLLLSSRGLLHSRSSSSSTFNKAGQVGSKSAPSGHGRSNFKLEGQLTRHGSWSVAAADFVESSSLHIPNTSIVAKEDRERLLVKNRRYSNVLNDRKPRNPFVFHRGAPFKAGNSEQSFLGSSCAEKNKADREAKQTTTVSDTPKLGDYWESFFPPESDIVEPVTDGISTVSGGEEEMDDCSSSSGLSVESAKKKEDNQTRLAKRRYLLQLTSVHSISDVNNLRAKSGGHMLSPFVDTNRAVESMAETFRVKFLKFLSSNSSTAKSITPGDDPPWLQDYLNCFSESLIPIVSVERVRDLSLEELLAGLPIYAIQEPNITAQRLRELCLLDCTQFLIQLLWPLLVGIACPTCSANYGIPVVRSIIGKRRQVDLTYPSLVYNNTYGKFRLQQFIGNYISDSQYYSAINKNADEVVMMICCLAARQREQESSEKYFDICSSLKPMKQRMLTMLKCFGLCVGIEKARKSPSKENHSDNQHCSVCSTRWEPDEIVEFPIDDEDDNRNVPSIEDSDYLSPLVYIEKYRPPSRRTMKFERRKNSLRQRFPKSYIVTNKADLRNLAPKRPKNTFTITVEKLLWLNSITALKLPMQARHKVVFPAENTCFGLQHLLKKLRELFQGFSVFNLKDLRGVEKLIWQSENLIAESRAFRMAMLIISVLSSGQTLQHMLPIASADLGSCACISHISSSAADASTLFALLKKISHFSFIFAIMDAAFSRQGAMTHLLQLLYRFHVNIEEQTVIEEIKILSSLLLVHKDEFSGALTLFEKIMAILVEDFLRKHKKTPKIVNVLYDEDENHADTIVSYTVQASEFRERMYSELFTATFASKRQELKQSSSMPHKVLMTLDLSGEGAKMDDQ